MATIMPQSELARKAIAWIDECLQEGKTFSSLCEEAAMRFNLSPRDVEFLKRFYKERDKDADDS